MNRRLLPLIAAAALTTACALELLGPGASLEGLPEGLVVSLVVEPVEVRQHAPFSTRLDVRNTTTDTIRVVTAHGCLAVPHVIRNGQRVPFAGSWRGCTAAITTHAFPPGETRSTSWQMRAELYAEHTGDTDGAPAPRGAYRVLAEFDTYPVGESRRKPAVETPLVIR